jgi:metal transporter CNNM
VVDRDIILVWVEGGRRIITGSDLLGRLLRRIARPPAERGVPAVRT